MKTGTAIDDEGQVNALKEIQRVFPSVIVKMQSKTPAGFTGKNSEFGFVGKTRPIPSKATIDVDYSTLPGYREMMEGLEKDKAGKHKGAMKLYERAGKLGNKGGFMNMGNCYMFGKGLGLFGKDKQD